MVRVVGVLRRLDGLKVRKDCVDVFARYLRVEIVRHHRVHVLSAPVYAVVHRPVKVVGRPVTDAGLRIGRDVGREHIAERRVHAPAAGEGQAAFLGMAGDAIAGAREVLASLDRIRRQILSKTVA